MKYTWLVEKYLEGELSGEALRRFELEILRNPEVARELEHIRSLQKFMENQHARMTEKGGLIEDYDDMENVIPEYQLADDLDGLRIRKISHKNKELREFRARLSEVEAGMELKKRRSNRLLVRRTYVWMAAASIILLFATSSVLFINNLVSSDYLSIYNNHFIPHRADVSVRAGHQTGADLYNGGLDLYNSGMYMDALDYFNRIPESDRVISYYLYSGISLMATGKHGEAITLFRELEKDTVLSHYGKWYTGLCYLAMGEEENARSVFHEIIASEGYNVHQARRILRKL